MSEGDIEKAVKEAAEYEAQDKKRKEAIDTRNEADSFVFQTEKALKMKEVYLRLGQGNVQGQIWLL